MKQLFHITNSQADLVQRVLSLRVGDRHVAFAVTGKAGDELYELAYCVAEEWNEKELTDLLRSYPVLKESFYEVLVSYDQTKNLILPSVGDAKENSTALMEFDGPAESQQVVISESIPGWQLINTFGVPKEIRDWINALFPAARTWHQYSLELKRAHASDHGHLRIDFRKDDFTAVLIKQNKFLLASSFEYATPEDVIYYLLKICQDFSLSQQEVQLQLSGLLDKQSALYKDIHQYFIHIEFRDCAWKMDGDYPAHFFTSLNDLAKCAS